MIGDVGGILREYVVQNPNFTFAHREANSSIVHRGHAAYLETDVRRDGQGDATINAVFGVGGDDSRHRYVCTDKDRQAGGKKLLHNITTQFCTSPASRRLWKEWTGSLPCLSCQ